MCDKMAISADIMKIVEKDTFLRLQMRAKEMFKSQGSYGFLITNELIFGFQILDLKDHFSASLIAAENCAAESSWTFPGCELAFETFCGLKLDRM